MFLLRSIAVHKIQPPLNELQHNRNYDYDDCPLGLDT